MIKLVELIQTEIPEHLYHATFNALVPEIQRDGLIPHGKTFRNWEDIPWGVYLSDDYDFAGAMVESSDNPRIPDEWFDEIVVIVINTKGLAPDHFDYDPNVTLPDNVSTQKSYIYRGVIPPENIVEIVDYT